MRIDMRIDIRLDTIHTSKITSRWWNTDLQKRGTTVTQRKKPPISLQRRMTTWNSELNTEHSTCIFMNWWEMAARRMALIELRESRGMQISRVQSAIVHSLEKDNKSLLTNMDIQGYVLILPYSLRNTYFRSDAAWFAIECREQRHKATMAIETVLSIRKSMINENWHGMHQLH